MGIVRHPPVVSASMTDSDTATSPKTVGIVLGSVRDGRFGEHVAHWVLDAATARDTDVTYQLIDLAAFDVPALTAAAVPGAAFVGYGADGAVRAVEHWRQIVANLSMLGVRNQVALSLFDDTSENQFAPRDLKASDLDKVLTDLEHALTR